ncbi:EamA family transporter [Natranaerofaba carboxydovora]|uniref:EamA family transporter n=1 Tax=Natranaerofaba carboxydovora TaxID=2742683 RepID=UPI001F139AD4|nr:DMT family transporter [Natranaerofaba carboxydovora]UMZ72497.1 EamA-like transporter family protein [Natranaerofaba carboxydovora]
MGEFLAIIAAFLFAVSNIFANQGMIKSDYSRYEGLFVSVVVNNILNLAILPFYILFMSVPSYNFHGIMAYIIAGFLTSFLGRYLLFECIERIKASRATVLKITAPVFTVILGVTVLNENLSPFELLGIAVVLIGVLVVSQDTQRFMNKNKSSEQNDNNKEKVKLNSVNYSKAKIGIILGILAGLSLGSGNVFRKLGTDFYGSPFLGVVIGSAVSLITLVIFSFLSKK